MFGCLPLPATGARQGLKAGDLVAEKEGSKANLACADLGENAGVGKPVCRQSASLWCILSGFQFPPPPPPPPPPPGSGSVKCNM